MAKAKKPKVSAFSTKATASKFGALDKSKEPSALMPKKQVKKDYGKNAPPDDTDAAQEFVGNANFGQTGLTGES